MNKFFIIFVYPFFLFIFSGCNAYYNLFYADPAKCFEIAKKNKPYDAIIVPGFPYDSALTNGVLEERIKWAAYLYKNGFTKNIIFSGAAVHSPYVEAGVMKLYAVKLGIPSEHIFKETKALHTTENLYYSSVMADSLGFHSVAFASEAAQTSFMKVFKRKWKLKVEMLPVMTNCIDMKENHFKPIDASSEFIPNFVPLEKREGKIKSLFGTRGHRVKVERRKVRREKHHQKKNI